MSTISSIHTPIVLTIAGSDSGGGAGIQADIKAISATGGYACSVITAITAQNTQGVSAVFPLPLAVVEQQLDAVFSDIPVLAVKIGMLADAPIIALVAKKLRQYQPKWIVLDPVMISTSGHHLLAAEAVETLIRELLPLANLITPNLPEAAVLVGMTQQEWQQNSQQGIAALRQLDTQAVLLKGGHNHQQMDSDDLLIEVDNIYHFRAPRIATKNTHGTGCSLSSAIASYLAQGHALKEAVEKAKQYIHQTILHADQLKIGQGYGPVHHFYQLQMDKSEA
ncbi:bifunctional hydroxymethylpyrimidine kinase/phosphomethylpyrimidine kinase [Vibrio cholerae]|uniref:bifunctional hydroxymethylpyrimidine kinase/phosphomethylpyrimidine kinase n=1 Tax=Vibrio cholerae TaxID=666 RepID=UPI000157E06E|nr:bifunctional hydroxymethylpyrimidine kinase/phosphomethylpyrimidine kinase [Vibrio cholerae]EFH75306.1 phosphomethylpyrimidine kinase [Vibrio cholerae RC385]EGQ7967667.1 bifunctional hydroxymethylpyrimidine kinase/phosphomethylpyrimidine kinase [Vibrio cholerae]EGR0580521.1 bifunctional hydroxymethylpyrimidine kinase/phosphomethylpyrimidine kinase [Vibrio cholerae]EGR5121020.1 bifunctional hydroxymethylpyrimidine kinase/phosphomethylpyrimidine kinase [Vibrio cholerae]EHV2408525.1 bifunction